MASLEMNVHQGMESPGTDVAMVTGDYDYYHYGCDDYNDHGWGCGYRTLQTLCSWVRRQQSDAGTPIPVPSIRDIQKALVNMEDKPDNFQGSRDWIGSVEVALCVNHFYQVPCRIVHIADASKLCDHVEQLYKHFQEIGAPIMMGGESDSSSKGILGVCRSPPSLLILDPHYKGSGLTKDELQSKNWVRWVLVKDFCQQSFYNLCMPVFKKDV